MPPLTVWDTNPVLFLAMSYKMWAKKIYKDLVYKPH